MKQTKIYTCSSYTSAKDSANMFYITSKGARRYNDNKTARNIIILGFNNKVLAIFNY